MILVVAFLFLFRFVTFFGKSTSSYGPQSTHEVNKRYSTAGVDTALIEQDREARVLLTVHISTNAGAASRMCIWH